MPKLSNNQLILLDNLIYLKGVADANSPKMSAALGKRPGGPVTVGEVCAWLKENLPLSKKRNGRYDPQGIMPAHMNIDEWANIVRIVKKDSELASLAIIAGEDICLDNLDVLPESPEKEYFKTILGHAAAAFQSIDKHVTVIFRGTSFGEWEDNLKAFTKQENAVNGTPRQKAALEFVASLPFNGITVSGHSKGGNKAQFVTIVSPAGKVGYCLSYYGQGFDKAFYKAHEDKVKAVENLISLLMVNDKPAGSIHALLPHRPNSILDFNGKLKEDIKLAKNGFIQALPSI